MGKIDIGPLKRDDLADTPDSGSFERKTPRGYGARYVYNHIVEPKMLLWLIEAAGVAPALVGNLTLVTQPLNGALSNRPWTDEEAIKVAPTGKDAGLGKRSLLHRYDILFDQPEMVTLVAIIGGLLP